MNDEIQANSLSSLRPVVLAFIVAVLAGAAAVIAAAGIQWNDEDLTLLLVLCGATVGAELFDMRLVDHSRVSVSVVLILAAGIITGLQGMVIVAATAALADHLAHSKPYYKTVFNIGALVLSGAVYVAVFEGFPVGSDGADWPTLLFPALLGVFANFIVNSALVASVIALDTGAPVGDVWNRNFRQLLPHYAVLGVLAATMASAYDLDGMVALLVVLAPLAMMRFVMKHAIEGTKEMLARLAESDLEFLEPGTAAQP